MTADVVDSYKDLSYFCRFNKEKNKGKNEQSSTHKSKVRHACCFANISCPKQLYILSSLNIFQHLVKYTNSFFFLFFCFSNRHMVFVFSKEKEILACIIN